jgi:hypothetical protein
MHTAVNILLQLFALWAAAPRAEILQARDVNGYSNSILAGHQSMIDFFLSYCSAIIFSTSSLN